MPVEGRAEHNIDLKRETYTTQTEVESKSMETQLDRIAKAAKLKPNEKFTSLIHLINKENIKETHKEMKGNKASGVDNKTKQEYSENLDDNVEKLINKMKRQAYKPLPAKRVFIPKPGSDKKRPLGILAYEDKLVQANLAKILNAIYEQDFLECSFGFRPNRSCHDALKVLNRILDKPEIQYVVDTDIRGFFDCVDHKWMMEFLKHRIADTNIIRLVSRMLKAGIIEAGIKKDTIVGKIQGGPCSPILANLYLHYVLDLWFEKIIKKSCKGKAYMIRYCDDSIFCFQHEDDARGFYKELKERLGKFNLETEDEKTKFICLNKNDKDDDGNNDNGGNKVNENKTFDFLGFTHYIGIDKKGNKRTKYKTSKKKYKASLLKLKEWIKANRTTSIRDFMKTLCSKLNGYARYYSITYNRNNVYRFFQEVQKLLYKWLNRRSQRKSFTWDKFNLFLNKYPLPKIKTHVSIYKTDIGSSYI